MTAPATPGDMAAGASLRAARPDEIDTLRAIDDDAALLYAQHGIALVMAPDHPFARAERARWLRSAELGRAFVLVDALEQVAAYAVLDVLDGQPYLDQLAVRSSAMRRGLGRRLLAHAADWARQSGGSAIWLTTYAHLPFNRPFYERHGYQVVPEAACGAGVRHHLEEQRRYLPAPEQRVAMRRAC
jgi:GNAT superfamily N-acetyltransferase